MKPTLRQRGKPAFDLIEEAVQLFRTAPVATLAVYYLGSMPFVLGLLFFWGEMSRSPFAYQHLSAASLGVGVLFLWMKFWQSIFARNIRAQLAAEPAPRLTFHRCLRIFAAQTTLQPFGLFIFPLAMVPLLPFPWVYTFFQNANALAGDEDGVAKLFKKSWRLAALWPMQNCIALGVTLGFAFYVFLNWITACLMLPGLFKVLFGVQSAFTKSPESLLNSTFFAAMFGLAYLCVDPVLKAIYAARCFYGESLESGEDLKAELKPFTAPAQKIAITVLVLMTLFLAGPARAAAPVVPPASSKNLSAADLDHAINQTIHESKYVWRMPREKIAEADSQDSLWAQFFDGLGKMLRQWAHTLGRWLDDLFRKLFPRRDVVPVSNESSGYGWILSVQMLLYGLVAVVLAALAVFLYRVWRNRGRSTSVIAAEAILTTPDVADENVGADQLPEDGWTKLARELLERGEFRLALRAFYLASLSHLAARNLISIARFKSNRDYGRELRRRGHAFPTLLSVFDDNVFAFERSWYGMHDVDLDLVTRFAANVERIKSAG